jgi:hypothetical protein
VPPKLSGTCQACFRTQALARNHNAIVLHGYRRPGTGFTEGRCQGADHQPWELSCEISKRWLARVTERRAFWASEIDRLNAPDLQSFEFSIERTSYRQPDDTSGWNYMRKSRQWYRFETFTVTRDHVPQPERGELNYADFAFYRKRKISDLQGWVKDASAQIDELERRIAAWVLSPDKLIKR